MRGAQFGIVTTISKPRLLPKLDIVGCVNAHVHVRATDSAAANTLKTEVLSVGAGRYRLGKTNVERVEPITALMAG